MQDLDHQLYLGENSDDHPNASDFLASCRYMETPAIC